MLGKLPERLEEESKQLGRDWMDSGYELSAGEYIELYASDELKEAHRTRKQHVEEMYEQGILV